MRDLIRDIVGRYEPKLADPDGGHMAAAVLLLLYERDGQEHLLFQVRSQQVEHHKGEISLPGGGRDPEDESLLMTALRETEEESDLDLVVVGTKEALTMVEAGGDEVPEATILEAFELAQREIVKLCEAQEELRSRVGKAKWLDVVSRDLGNLRAPIPVCRVLQRTFGLSKPAPRDEFPRAYDDRVRCRGRGHRGRCRPPPPACSPPASTTSGCCRAGTRSGRADR